MRKLIWCCSAAGLLATGGFLSLTYYAYRCPCSVVGRSMKVLAQASVAIQPLSGLTSLAVRVNQANATGNDSAGSIEAEVPDDPFPIVLEPPDVLGHASISAEDDEALQARIREENRERRKDTELEAAPIVIGEEDPMPREEAEDAGPASNDVAAMQRQEIPPKDCPVFMPYCRDDDEETETPPKMPRAEADAKTKHSDFREWMELFEENKVAESSSVEELPPPKEWDPNADPKCQEDSHLHEHYPGCPRTTCPYCPIKKKGGEESSEEPQQPAKKPEPSENGKDKEQCPRTQGVDTMEYRKSDAGLDEYGPGRVH